MRTGAHPFTIQSQAAPPRLLAAAAASRIGALLADADAAPLATEPAHLGQPSRAGRVIFLLFAASALHAAAPSGSFVAPAFVPRATAGSPREESSMYRTKSVVSMAGAVALSVGSAGFAQDAVQWRVEDGGNGHWYGIRSISLPDVPWLTMKTTAESLGGHLITLSSPQEDAFAFAYFVSLQRDMMAGPLGLFFAPDGSWRWVTGEPLIYTNWRGACCGNPAAPDNNGLQPFATWTGPEQHPSIVGRWEDWSDPELGSPAQPFSEFLLEWSADCNADGVIDFGQIRAGELDDLNANNIPDCCEAGAPCGCDADITGNGFVDGADLAAVLNAWGGAAGGKSAADVNRDGAVDGQDLALVLGSWGSCG